MVEIVTQSRVDAARKHWRDLDRRMAAVGWQINQAAFLVMARLLTAYSARDVISWTNASVPLLNAAASRR